MARETGSGPAANVLVAASSADGESILLALLDAGYVARLVDPAVRLDPSSRALVVHAFADDAAELLVRAVSLGIPTVLSCSPGRDVPRSPPGNAETTCVERVLGWTADAYAWRTDKLAEAVAWVCSENRDARRTGPTRLVYLGLAGADRTHCLSTPAFGASFTVSDDRPLLIGRVTQNVDIKLSTRVARIHARVTRTTTGVRVEDLATTNGTWVRTVRAEEHMLSPAEEIAVAAFIRLRLDGERCPSFNGT